MIARRESEAAVEVNGGEGTEEEENGRHSPHDTIIAQISTVQKEKAPD